VDGAEHPVASVEWNGAELSVVRGDITEQRTDVVVNAANGGLMGGGGVDGAIHRRGGPAILEACRVIRRTKCPDGLPAGGAVLTTAGELPARWVVHAVGPVWRGGDAGEAEALASAYRESMRRASEVDARSIAFPSISTGAYGYPVERAAEIAVGAVAAWLREHPSVRHEVRWVAFSASDFEVYARALEALDG
jgi:O-acetyl-ADP-ribose deacetylase